MAVRSALVVGAGIAGSAVAGLLARGGVEVDLVEVRTDAYSPDAGIVLRPNALRVLRDLGVADQVVERGFTYADVGLRTAQAGALVGEIEPPGGGSDLPAFVGYHRSSLAQELLECAVEAGVQVHGGTSPVHLDQDPDGVTVGLEDETEGRYDLVVGAEGVRSWTRRRLDIELRTTRNQIAAWRALLPRPASVTRSELYVDGPRLLLGCAPAGPDTVNAFVLERLTPDNASIRRRAPIAMQELTADYHGLWDDVRAEILDTTSVHFGPFETHSLRPPWNRGRVVLIGDAVHAAPPTIGQGIALALEDASVLADLVLAAEDLDGKVWVTYHARRVPRVEATMSSTREWTDRLLAGDPGDLRELLGQMSRRLDDEPA